MTAPVFYWHIHHETLCEPLTEPIEKRIAYITSAKARTETPEQIALRLRLMRPVRGTLPEAFVTARSAYNTARSACDTAWGACDTAWWAAYNTARGACDTAWWAAYNTARGAYFTARSAYNTARGAYFTARSACAPDIAALHAQECPDCPWDGRSIFPEVTK